MRCEQLEEIVFSGREPDERERAEMRRHAEVCEACRVLLEQGMWLSGAREMDEDVEVPESFAQGWRRAVRRAPRANSVGRRMKFGLPRGGLARGAAYAACALVLLGAGTQIGRLTSEKALSSAAAYDWTPQSYSMETADSAAMYSRSAAGGGALLSGAETSEEKILRSASLELKTDDLDAAVASIKARVESAGGRVTSCDVYAVEETRYAGLELSIPDGELDAFLEGTGELGEVTRAQSSLSDMTASYQDNESRLESARAQKQRLDELYASAEDMEDIVTITGALFEVQQQIDRLEGANRSIDERAANAQVSLSITEEAGEGKADGSLLARLGEQAQKGLGQLIAFFDGMIMFVAWALPWLALVALLSLFAYAAGRFFRRRKM
ncbi:MAG: DUF4349 domain-containing protein [Clostridia bacterium]|nr:DUF4349 domain-containing protein [Clostridia bacterium]